MSYILEALKRSQQERELGRVPTLGSVPPPGSEPRYPVSPWWIGILALAALGVSLYALILTRLPMEAPRPPVAQVPAAGQPVGATGAPQAAAVAAGATAAPSPGIAQATAAGTPGPTAAALPEGPPGPLGPPGGWPDLVQGPAAVGPAAPIPEPDLSDVPMAPMEARPARPAPLEAVGAAVVPPDLRQEVERFKRQVAKEERATPKAKPGAQREPEAPSVPTPAAAVAAPDPDPLPTTNEAAATPIPPVVADTAPALVDLPKAIQAKLPAQRLTVHVYGADPEGRFVVYGSQRLRVGERSREGATLKAILPDGATLEFEGQRFFVPR